MYKFALCIHSLDLSRVWYRYYYDQEQFSLFNIAIKSGLKIATNVFLKERGGDYISKPNARNILTKNIGINGYFVNKETIAAAKSG